MTAARLGGHPLAELLEQFKQDVASEVAELLTEQLHAPNGRTYYTAEEAAEYLRCKVERIYNLVSDERLPRRKEGGRLLFKREDLDALVEVEP